MVTDRSLKIKLTQNIYKKGWITSLQTCCGKPLRLASWQHHIRVIQLFPLIVTTLSHGETTRLCLPWMRRALIQGRKLRAGQRAETQDKSSEMGF